MRLFVAVWPAPDVVAVLRAQPRPDHPAVRWTTEEQWHVTLRFLGAVDDGSLPPLERALHDVAARHQSRTATLGPTTRRLGRGLLVAPVAGVDDLAASVVEATAAHGRPPEGRPFTGHLTLARGRGRRPVPAALAGAAIEAAWEVSSFALVRSELHPDGARYTDVATFPLAG